MQIILFNYFGAKPNPLYEVLAEALRQRDHDVLVGQFEDRQHIVWRNGKDNEIRTIATQNLPDKIKGKPLLPRIYSMRSDFASMKRARDLINSIQPDIVQVNTNRYPWLLPVFNSSNTRYILDIRQINESPESGTRARLGELMKATKRNVLAKSVFDHTFFCHEEAAKHILGKNWPRYSTVIPVGVDEHFLLMDNDQIAKPIDDEQVSFIYIGTLSRLRNLEQLFYAAKILKTTEQSFRLVLVGPDRSDGYFQKKIEELSLTDNVSILPPIPYKKVPQFLSKFHVGVAYVPDRPTWHYQPTIKVLEYRALGMPIISTDVASHRGIVQDGNNGVMVEDSPESIANGMRRFVTDRTFLNQCIHNAQMMRSGLIWDDIARMYEEMYLQLLEGS